MQMLLYNLPEVHTYTMWGEKKSETNLGEDLIKNLR